MFGPIMKRELTQNFSNEIIQKTNQNLKALVEKYRFIQEKLICLVYQKEVETEL